MITNYNFISKEAYGIYWDDEMGEKCPKYDLDVGYTDITPLLKRDSGCYQKTRIKGAE